MLTNKNIANDGLLHQNMLDMKATIKNSWVFKWDLGVFDRGWIYTKKMIKEEKKKYTIRHNKRDGRKTKLAAKDTAKYRENMILSFGKENDFYKEIGKRKKKER